MRKALLVLVVCALASPAWAGGGFSLFGAWSEVTDDSQSFGGGARLSIGGERWVGDLTWTWLQSQSDVDIIAGIEDKIQVIPTDLGIRYLFNTSGAVKPYAGGGVTWFYNSLTNGSASNDPGLYGMIGFNFGKGRAAFFVEGIYRYAQSDIKYVITPNDVITGELDVGGFGVNFGVAWGF